MTIDELLSRLTGVKRTKNGWEARCPAHDDRKASLSISEGKKAIVLYCHAGCSVNVICDALTLKVGQLFRNGEAGRRSKPAMKIVATYDYQSKDGKLLFQVCRFDPKDFRQRRPDPSAKCGWTWNTQGVRRVLFRLPQAIAAVKDGKPVYVCEGEKDVLAMERAGFVATCNPGGAGKWCPSYSETLRGAEVVIIADKDAPGRRHAADVAAKLHGFAKSVRVLELPDVNGKAVKDAADYLAASGEAAELDELAWAAPEWAPKKITAGSPGTETPEGDKLTVWIRGEIISLLLDEETPAATKRSLIAKKVVEALTKLGRFYFHADWRDFDSAMFFDSRRKRLERIRSDAFGAWLSEWLNVNRADTLFRFILADVETAALSGSHTIGISPEAFWTARPNAIYLSNGDGAAARIRAEGVDLVDNGSDGVLFAAGRTLAPWALCEPQDPFEVCSIFRNAHCAAAHGRELLRLWAYSLPSNPATKPPLCFAGPIGSGKTRTIKAVAELYGLPFVAAKVEDDAENNFWPNVDQGGLYTLDNADSKCRWLADSIANAATDGCSQRRKLYTDSETVVLRARAWLCITTANPTFASDAGLADRLLVVRMERRSEETSDGALTVEIKAARDGGLSHIAATLQRALTNTGPTPARLNERHPDFAALAVRIGRALGREAEAIAALRAAEVDKSAFCLENDPIGAAVLGYLTKAGAFTGTAAELLPRLAETDKELEGKVSAKRLSKRLSALWPHLQKALAVAQREPNRLSVAVFTLKADPNAGFAGFQTDFPENPPC